MGLHVTAVTVKSMHASIPISSNLARISLKKTAPDATGGPDPRGRRRRTRSTARRRRAAVDGDGDAVVFV